jgi:hypothetical protein
MTRQFRRDWKVLFAALAAALSIPLGVAVPAIAGLRECHPIFDEGPCEYTENNQRKVCRFPNVFAGGVCLNRALQAVVSGCADTWPPVGLVSNSGEFNSGQCSGLFAGVPDVCLVGYNSATATGPALAEACVVSFNGTYDNIVCGTGAADGEFALTSASTSEMVAFHATFVAGIGVITGVSSEQWAGIVDIVPTNGSCPIPQFRYSVTILGGLAPA